MPSGLVCEGEFHNPVLADTPKTESTKSASNFNGEKIARLVAEEADRLLEISESLSRRNDANQDEAISILRAASSRQSEIALDRGKNVRLIANEAQRLIKISTTLDRRNHEDQDEIVSILKAAASRLMDIHSESVSIMDSKAEAHEEMRGGPRTYTADQAEFIRETVRNREELPQPLYPLDGDRLEVISHTHNMIKNILKSEPYNDEVVAVPASILYRISQDIKEFLETRNESDTGLANDEEENLKYFAWQVFYATEAYKNSVEADGQSGPLYAAFAWLVDDYLNRAEPLYRDHIATIADYHNRFSQFFTPKELFPIKVTGNSSKEEEPESETGFEEYRKNSSKLAAKILGLLVSHNDHGECQTGPDAVSYIRKNFPELAEYPPDPNNPSNTGWLMLLSDLDGKKLESIDLAKGILRQLVSHNDYGECKTGAPAVNYIRKVFPELKKYPVNPKDWQSDDAYI